MYVVVNLAYNKYFSHHFEFEKDPFFSFLLNIYCLSAVYTDVHRLLLYTILCKDDFNNYHIQRIS